MNIVTKYIHSLCVYQLPGLALDLLTWHREAIDFSAN
ncbi:hypothetical protein VCR4J2_340131 [Vibrio coralliirubri]|nr:hypothetical protein VCR4J2_340131 [Vibrio coralliirubri]